MNEIQKVNVCHKDINKGNEDEYEDNLLNGDSSSQETRKGKSIVLNHDSESHNEISFLTEHEDSLLNSSSGSQGLKNETEKVNIDIQETPKRKYIVINHDSENHKESSETTLKKKYRPIAINHELNKSYEEKSGESSGKQNNIEINHENDRTKMKLNYEHENTHCDPNFAGYQLVGDSQFCRFGQQILGLERTATPNGKGRIGICVSGQTISDLHKRVNENYYPISDKIILMIGTNDFLKGAEVSTMCQHLTALVNTLMKKTSCIILLTLPPVPKLANSSSHWERLEKYNKHIKKLCDGESVLLGDISHLYHHPKIFKCQMSLFETFFPGRVKRFDMIHLNRKGLELIRNFILDHF